MVVHENPSRSAVSETLRPAHLAATMFSQSLLIISVENCCAASYFCGNHDALFPLMNRKFKREAII